MANRPTEEKKQTRIELADDFPYSDCDEGELGIISLEVPERDEEKLRYYVVTPDGKRFPHCLNLCDMFVWLQTRNSDPLTQTPFSQPQLDTIRQRYYDNCQHDYKTLESLPVLSEEQGIEVPPDIFGPFEPEIVEDSEVDEDSEDSGVLDVYDQQQPRPYSYYSFNRFERGFPNLTQVILDTTVVRETLDVQFPRISLGSGANRNAMILRLLSIALRDPTQASQTLVERAGNENVDVTTRLLAWRTYVAEDIDVPPNADDNFYVTSDWYERGVPFPCYVERIYFTYSPTTEAWNAVAEAFGIVRFDFSTDYAFDCMDLDRDLNYYPIYVRDILKDYFHFADMSRAQKRQFREQYPEYFDFLAYEVPHYRMNIEGSGFMEVQRYYHDCRPERHRYLIDWLDYLDWREKYFLRHGRFPPSAGAQEGYADSKFGDLPFGYLMFLYGPRPPNALDAEAQVWLNYFTDVIHALGLEEKDIVLAFPIPSDMEPTDSVRKRMYRHYALMRQLETGSGEVDNVAINMLDRLGNVHVNNYPESRTFREAYDHPRRKRRRRRRMVDDALARLSERKGQEGREIKIRDEDEAIEFQIQERRRQRRRIPCSFNEARPCGHILTEYTNTALNPYTRLDLIDLAIACGLSYRHPDGSVKTVDELCEMLRYRNE